jgi:predicted nuclease of restriction endonuclease-like (RecB) superfamily
MKKTHNLTKTKNSKPSTKKGDLLEDLRKMIDQAKRSVASVVNTHLIALNWQMGRRIYSEILKKKRAGYGKEILATVSQELTKEYGHGFTLSSLSRMLKFAELFPDEQIVATLSQQLSWSHFVEILPLKEPLKRDFYAEMCRIERWSVRTLRKKIDSMFYERTAISKKPELVAQAELEMLRKEDRLTPDLVFRDPYVLEFLNLNDRYLERDLEDAIMRELEQFLLELGAGFSFLARQKCITIDDEDFHIDLLFFHRDLKRLVAIELKLGDFKAAHKGQMELYLRWLDKHERRLGEESPIGLILCAGKKKEQIELLELGNSGIHVAEYLTVLPSKEVLQEKLHKAIEHARQRFEKNEDNIDQ